jgi:hypothetical protein
MLQFEGSRNLGGLMSPFCTTDLDKRVSWLEHRDNSSQIDHWATGIGLVVLRVCILPDFLTLKDFNGNRLDR